MDIGSVSSYIDLCQAGHMRKPPAKPSIEDMTNRLIQDKDEDGSGGLSIDELCISEEAFAQADADGNGELDSQELIENAETIGKELGPPPDAMGPPPKPSIEEMTQRLIQDKDKDGSGTLSINELGISEETFALADTDGNGELDSEELIASAEIIGKELGPPPGMMGPPPKPEETSETQDATAVDLIEKTSKETGVDLVA